MKQIDEQTGTGEQTRELTVSYHFSSAARAVGQGLRIGDYVGVLGLDDKYELMDIFRRRNSVRVRAIGRTDQLYLPWRHVRPWKEESPK